jgi:integrase
VWPPNVLHSIQALCEKLGLPSVRFYDLRHIQASLLIAQGVHKKMISERLDHSSITLTMDTYGHLFPGADKEASNHMDTILSAGNGEMNTPAPTRSSLRLVDKKRTA